MALAVSIVPGTPAGAAFSDSQCAEASQYVNAFSQLTQADPPQKVYDAAHAVVSAYDSCQKRQLSNGNVEPGVHYAYVRLASFGVVEARALLALNRPSDAKAVLETSKRFASEVYDWRGNMTATYSSDTKDNRKSLYYDAAKDILDAANAMLAKLNAPRAAPAGPAFTPAPKMSPSP
jgi:hypothetical protein